MNNTGIQEKIRGILSEIPENVQVVAAVKARTLEEIQEAVASGINIIGQNYIQEAEKIFNKINGSVKSHFIGHLQKNKVKKAVKIFDLIETVDSIALAKEIDDKSGTIGKVMPVFIEVNSACENQKNGVMPDEVLELINQIKGYKNIRIVGLMTMGPFLDTPEKIRPYFKITKEVYDNIVKMNIENVHLEKLSMGMSDSYKVAISEGANLVRIGTKIFGERKKRVCM